jgi:tRNA pseudouridine38-40 synthase
LHTTALISDISAKRSQTVQGEIEKALKTIGWNGRAIASSGRTDTGTHAVGQVISFDIDWNHGAEKLMSALIALFQQILQQR